MKRNVPAISRYTRLLGLLLAAAPGWVAIGAAGEAPGPIPTFTKEQMQEATGEKYWKCTASSVGWLSEAIRQIGTIEVDATRRSLEILFQPSDGNGSRFRQRFDYRDHRDDLLLYVEVEFNPDPARLPLHPDADRISKISVPYMGIAQHASEQRVPAPWVDEAIRNMLAVRPGMTRKRLLETFRGGGGISNDIQGGFVSRDCPFFRVDVTFEPVGRPARDAAGRVTMDASGEDRIVSISRPFLAFDPAD